MTTPATPGGFARRLRHGVWRTRSAADWPALAPDAVMAVDVRDRFHAKQGRSIARWTLHRDHHRLTVYLKRHFRAPWWHGLAALVRPGRGWSAAWQEAEHLAWAEAHGFAVPRVLAAGEQVGPWGRLQSFLAVEELTGMLPLHEAVPAAAALPGPAFAAWKRGLAVELARVTRRLHALRHFHKDLYFCHFYVPGRFAHAAPPDWEGRVFLIDLHRLGHHPRAWRWWQLKDLAQLLYSSDVPGVTARDRLRFWRLYAGAGRRAWWGRLLRRAVLVRWNNYRQHNAGRKGGPPRQSAA
jgi:heptose I phosphotransferase